MHFKRRYKICICSVILEELKSFKTTRVEYNFPSPQHSVFFSRWPAVQAYFGRAKAGCLCSYCCNRHLRVSTCAFASKTFTRLKKTPALPAIQSDALNTELLEAQVTRKGHSWAKKHKYCNAQPVTIMSMNTSI